MSKKPSSTDTMLAQLIIKTYCPDTIQDVHEIVHTLFVSILEQMEENEIDRFIAGSPGNYKNGHITRILRSIYGELHLSLPRDRFSCYESRLFPKHIRTLPLPFVLSGNIRYTEVFLFCLIFLGLIYLFLFLVHSPRKT